MSQTANQERKKDLIDRYIYDVTRRLPENMRQDVGKELRILIEDMAEEREIDAVLMELGDPAFLARKYRGGHDSLIGGQYYDWYWYIMKIVLICAACGLVVSGMVEYIVGISEEHIMYLPVSRFFSIPGILLQIFGGITLVFMILEKYNVRISRLGVNVTGTETRQRPDRNGIEWNVNLLPQIPAGRAVVKKRDEIAEILFSVIAAMIFIVVPHWLGAWVSGSGTNGLQVIPIFNLSAWGSILPLMLLSILAGMIKGIIKLTQGYYNILVMITVIGANVLSLLASTVIFRWLPVWNPRFVLQLEEVFHLSIGSREDILYYWNTAAISNIVLAVIAVSLLIDTGLVVYRTIRYQQIEQTM